MINLAIVGAGFSGLSVAVELLHALTKEVRIILINRTGQLGKGMAYGTNSPLHLLNVPAGNMSARHGHAASFVDYCRSRGYKCEPSSFMERSLYGEYLQDLLRKSADEAMKGLILEMVQGDVVSVQPGENKVWLKLADGSLLSVDHVVLAFGNFPPAHPLALLPHRKSRFYYRDPWDARLSPLAATKHTGRTALIGSGLTAIDVALTLATQMSAADLPIHMLSRRGVLPSAHRPMRGTPLSYDDLHKELEEGPAAVLAYARCVRDRLRQADSDEDWRDIVGSLRPITRVLWQRLPSVEQKRFIRHYQPYWDVHRHRMAPATAQRFAELVKDGAIRLHAGSLKEAAETDGGIEMVINQRGTSVVTKLNVDWLINCTGPTNDLGRVDDRLVADLAERGLLTPSQLGLGINVRDDFTIVNRLGLPIERLSYIGPLLKNQYGEATSVPELRMFAYQLAQHMAIKYGQLKQRPLNL